MTERRIAPEHRIKFQIENQLDMAGLNVPAGKPMQELVDAIFAAIFNKATAASVQQVLIDVSESDDNKTG